MSVQSTEIFTMTSSKIVNTGDTRPITVHSTLVLPQIFSDTFVIIWQIHWHFSDNRRISGHFQFSRQLVT